MMLTSALSIGYWVVSFRIFWNHYAEQNEDWNWAHDPKNPDNQRNNAL